MHPAVLAARDAWTPGSRAAFAQELFERWLTAGAPAPDGWCMQAVGLIGDDAGARRIAALAKHWPGQGASARAQPPSTRCGTAAPTLRSSSSTCSPRSPGSPCSRASPASTLTEWGEVFADYELLQPFEQLGRPVHRIRDDERGARAIDRFEGRKVTVAVLRGLERHGWTRWYDAAVQMAKPIGGGVYVVLNTEPGWHASDTVDSAPPQTVADLVLARAGGRTFGDLPPVVFFSELIHDLRVVT
ncbi:DUF4132 domain-containing protein [Dactylosporangium sp. NPDC000521]|uniref:DUF4132 domain-containing protein n=1 Tax=Dactylosporangium sp. NPDC000521 TaxID=3363975 RepID=UPI0036836098